MVSTDEIQRAAQRIQAGELVAFPTETVYGLGANALSDVAVARIFALKGRPSFNPLIIHVGSVEQAKQYVEFSPLAEHLARHFWPGALTFVLPRKKDGISLLACAGLDTAAVRMPAHPVAKSLLLSAGVPIAAPSANRSGRVSPTEAQHVRDEFGAEALLVLDGGACTIGLESTVLDLTSSVPALLRPGSITKEMLEQVLQLPVEIAQADAAIASPGMLLKHYSPSIPVRLNVVDVREGEALLAYGSHALPHKGKMLNLSEKGDLQEAAAHLFSYLRLLDDAQHASIAVMPIPQENIGIAINDRLKRAAEK